jgi:hypothetical protein
MFMPKPVLRRGMVEGGWLGERRRLHPLLLWVAALPPPGPTSLTINPTSPLSLTPFSASFSSKT